MTTTEDFKFIRIEKDFRINILDDPAIKPHLSELLSSSEKEIHNKIGDILEFLNLSHHNKPGSELSVNNLANLFELYFRKAIVIEAISIALTVRKESDILSNIKGLIDHSKISNAINGDVMVLAFKKAIAAEKGIINRSKKIEILEQKYSRKIRHNYCGGCGCKCACNADCGGDVRRCTSKEALSKNCTHCCHCYLREIVINLY